MSVQVNNNVAGPALDSVAVAAAVGKQAFTGVIASRCSVPTALAGGTLQLMSRSKHYAMEKCASIQLVYANWYVKDTATVGENNTGGSLTITASVEDAYGTVLKVATFSGSTTGVIPDGQEIISDPIAFNTTPGVPFFVRTWASHPTGIPYNKGSGNLNDVTSAIPVSGETWTFGSSITDTTQSFGGFNNLSATLIFRPTAIVGLTSRPVIFIAGDSRESNGTVGAVLDSAATDGYGLVGNTNRSLGQIYATLNAGCSSEQLQNVLTTGYTKRLRLLQYCNKVVCGYGVNDLINGRTALQIEADLTTFAARFGGLPFHQQTIQPQSTSTDGWVTTVNQTTTAINAARVTLNAWIRKCPPPFAGVIEVADPVESARDSGIWKASYTGDGLHCNSTASIALANSNTVKIPGSVF